MFHIFPRFWSGKTEFMRFMMNNERQILHCIVLVACKKIKLVSGKESIVNLPNLSLSSIKYIFIFSYNINYKRLNLFCYSSHKQPPPVSNHFSVHQGWSLIGGGHLQENVTK